MAGVAGAQLACSDHSKQRDQVHLDRNSDGGQAHCLAAGVASRCGPSGLPELALASRESRHLSHKVLSKGELSCLYCSPAGSSTSEPELARVSSINQASFSHRARLFFFQVLPTFKVLKINNETLQPCL